MRFTNIDQYITNFVKVILSLKISSLIILLKLWKKILIEICKVK